PRCSLSVSRSSFSFNDSAPTEIYTLSLHDALPISARIAIAMAIRDTRSAFINESKPEQAHVINRDVLFGEHEKAYEALIRQFCAEQNIQCDIQDVIRSLIDSGLHKLGHVKKLSDLKTTFQQV